MMVPSLEFKNTKVTSLVASTYENEAAIFVPSSVNLRFLTERPVVDGKTCDHLIAFPGWIYRTKPL